MKKIAIACFVSSLFLVGCGPQDLTPEQKQQVDGLKVELSQVVSDISDAKSEDQKYSSGLIKGLIKTRLEVLETNKALLQQRINAIESGAKIETVISAVKPDLNSAASILKDIDGLKVEIDSAKKDASQYSGGLVLAMKAAAIATQEQTLALLQQRYLSAKYGLADIKAGPIAGGNQIDGTAASTSQSSSSALLPPADGPFGLQAGLTKKNIEDMTGEVLKPVDGKVNLYMLSATPKKNPDFESFGLLISPKAGLCQIRALGKDINSDSYGFALKSKFDEISNTLKSIYGDGKKTDFLLSGSIWKDPNDWMMGLVKGERVLMMEWKGKNEVMEKNEISEVGMDVRANNSSSGYVFLQYTFSNNSVCEAEIDSDKKSSL
ncbi:hypothetical protein [Enterobacter roggenkampii]|uniref:hypothetical protein n=1 Tax=Enterobacter roggenkampii TaxID=1812935 RepID=UPI001854807A|nr:hypothetical protein [Enterobacter roggenkampii]EFD1072903.1 hypothetical protein [Escherichia coli]MBW9438416.1 hypothetical protein [Enterobacter roggenkampii]MCK7041407.1 hypothetical protein [Enterobacter roggenkampii]UOZ12386.1 hypothetical protein LCD41_13195 [Enterobacter roggenkampii]